MTDLDWNIPPQDERNWQERHKAIMDIDVVKLLEIDPRDEIFGDLFYYHPDPIPLSAQIGGVGFQAVLWQLILTDMIAVGLVDRTATGDVKITKSGLSFANARLVGPDVNSIYRVRDNAPAYVPLSAAATIAVKHLILNASPDIRSMTKDNYHPLFGRATFD
jgi:hypothetical protein